MRLSSSADAIEPHYQASYLPILQLASLSNHPYRSYLELALNGPLDHETRDNLNVSHTASKNLLFTINDLLVGIFHLHICSAL